MDTDAATHHQRQCGGNGVVQHIPNHGVFLGGEGGGHGHDVAWHLSRVNEAADGVALPARGQLRVGEVERGVVQALDGDCVDVPCLTLARHLDHSDVVKQAVCHERRHPAVDGRVALCPQLRPEGVGVNVLTVHLDEVVRGAPARLLVDRGLTAHRQRDADGEGATEHITGNMRWERVHPWGSFRT